ncbi:MAG: helix-turn-helix domain-containing protein [Terriglobales bacterium]
MGTFGEKLQREREMRGITLDEIAEATKIGTRSLRALEEQDFDKLPGGIFNKGFVRAYSKYLGIDEDQAVADYVEAVNDAQVAGKLSRPDVEPPPAALDDSTSEPVRIPWTALICVALLIAVGFAARSYYAKFGWHKLFRKPAPAQAAQITPAPRPAPPPVSVPSTPTPAAAQSTAAANSTPPEDGFTVKIHAKEIAWVEVEADGKLVVSENLAANADRVVQAARQVVIRTGNAGGIEVSENNKTLPPLGPRNEVRTLTLHGQESQNQ